MATFHYFIRIPPGFGFPIYPYRKLVVKRKKTFSKRSKFGKQFLQLRVFFSRITLPPACSIPKTYVIFWSRFSFKIWVDLQQ
jgi:hypothetical protein